MPNQWYTGAADSLATLVADCTAFRTLVGATNQAEALQRCHYTEAPDELANNAPIAPRPRMIYGNSSGYRWARQGSHIKTTNRPIWMMIEASPPPNKQTDEEQARWFGEFLDSLIDEMFAKVLGGDEYLVIEAIEAKTEMMLVRPEEADGERFWFIALEVL